MSTFEIQGATQQGRDLGTIAGLIAEFHAAGLPLNVHSNVYGNALAVKSGPGYLFGFSVYNSKNAAQFIQVFDSNVLPAEGAVPDVTYTVATIANLAVQWLPLGRSFHSGIYIVNSSTGPTKTIGSADCFFDAQYI